MIGSADAENATAVAEHMHVKTLTYAMPNVDRLNALNDIVNAIKNEAKNDICRV